MNQQSRPLSRLGVGLLMILSWPLAGWGQQSAFHQDTLFLAGMDTLPLSHGFLVPYSTWIMSPDGTVLPEASYGLDDNRGEVWLLQTPALPGAYVVHYRYFDPPPAAELALRKRNILRDSLTQAQQVDVFFEDPNLQQNQLFWESERIRKSGSFTRGLTLGNNRGLSVTSGLRLQLEGDLGDGLQIIGSITDENLPIQPDGTTQQISDFDKVFVKLSQGPYQITIGDYEINRKSTRFANLYRNVLGLQAGVSAKTTKASVSGAVAKGKFHTNAFMGLEGVSGPYRLTGRNNERFFIILAGSERVYLNGKLMTRGENQDYIIDYNTAEITFTARNVITNITRIVVDFEYNDRYYNRSLLVADVEQRLLDDRLRFRLAYSRDADNPNAPFDDPEAFAQVRDSLALAGENATQATTSGITQLGYDPDLPRYAQRDTIINGQAYRYYEYSNDSIEAIYGIFFSYVGPNNGFYQRSQAGINDNVFEWVPPNIQNQPQGDYAPVRTWVLPQLLQVIDAQLDWKVSEHFQVYSETAISSLNRNRLAQVGDVDQDDLAQRSGLRLKALPLSDSLSLSLDLYHQYIGARYRNLDRVYQAEYDRVWDLPASDLRRNEQIINGAMTLSWLRKIDLRVEGGMRGTGPGRQALRQVFRVQSYLPRFLQGNYTFTHIQNRIDSLGRKSRWLRQEGDVYAPLGKWQPGVVLWWEDKQVQFFNQIGEGSFNFLDLKPYLRTAGTKRLQLEAYFNYRQDRAWLKDRLRDKSIAYTYYLRAQFQPAPVFQLQSISSYRILNVQDTAFLATGIQNSRVLNTNLQSTFSPKNRIVYSNVLYEVSSEQLAQREVRYLQVLPGQGQYVWLDSLFNDDGIQDVEEFQLANNPLIADFIRVVVPTRELFPTNRLSFTGTLRWDFRKAWKKSPKFGRELLRNVRANTSFRMIQNKARNRSLSGYLIDFTNPFADSSLLDANYTLRQDLSFFQNSPVGDIRFTYQDNQSKLFLSTGNEFRGLRYGSSAQRLNLSSTRSIEAETRVGRKFVEAASFPSRNYDIAFVETGPKVNFQASRQFRFSLGYGYTHRKNRETDGAENARVDLHKAILDARINFKDRNNLLTKLELVALKQVGEPGFSAAYELREGLQPGFNAVWQAFFTWYLLDNVELSFNYDGRISSRVPMIHTGRVQIRALF